MDTRSLLLSEQEEQSGCAGNGRGVLAKVSDGIVVNGVNGNGAPKLGALPRRSHLSFQELAARIEERVQNQTCCRVRNLVVNVTDENVILRGRCSTFYTKQLAQHAAMGVLEDEVLINDILVVTAR